MTASTTDTDELARFGYKQELDRSLGLVSSFAAGFSYISIMTGVFELFFFGFARSWRRSNSFSRFASATRSSNCAGARRPTTSSSRRR